MCTDQRLWLPSASQRQSSVEGLRRRERAQRINDEHDQFAQVFLAGTDHFHGLIGRAGQRYVIALRDPRETYISFYRFFNSWQLERDALALDDFMPLWMGGGPEGCDYFTHLLSWYERRNEEDTLLMTYPWVTRNR